MPRQASVRRSINWLTLLCLLVLSFSVNGHDLAEVKQTGVLRHLGIAYANFVTGDGRGLDLSLIHI